MFSMIGLNTSHLSANSPLIMSLVVCFPWTQNWTLQNASTTSDPMALLNPMDILLFLCPTQMSAPLSISATMPPSADTGCWKSQSMHMA